MVRKKVTVKNEEGLHARPSSALVQLSSKFKSDFYIEMQGFRINGKSILGVMTLAAEHGAEMELILDGEDEEEALAAISDPLAIDLELVERCGLCFRRHHPLITNV